MRNKKELIEVNNTLKNRITVMFFDNSNGNKRLFTISDCNLPIAFEEINKGMQNNYIVKAYVDLTYDESNINYLRDVVEDEIYLDKQLILYI